MATNSQIIFNKEIELAQKGLIPTMERKITVNYNGETLEMNEPTRIHTASGWRSKGYLVRKGEHAVASLNIWHNINERPGDDAEAGEDGTVAASRMERRRSHFFSIEQVEPVPVPENSGAAA